MRVPLSRGYLHTARHAFSKNSDLDPSDRAPITGTSFRLAPSPPRAIHRPPRRVVVAVMIDVGPEENAFLAPLFTHLPQKEGEGTCLQTEGLADVLLGDRGGFYRYDGSLTTPDCSEHVQWILMERPILASAEQIGRFISVFPDNARHVQPTGGRTITFYPGGPAHL
ncbi:carbonic anhydrase family protein [Polyangium jinanense]|nr:carbonic anhydrase family protein [Polyangium jinanense]